ncbi:MAG: hypothetical protein ACR2PL_20385 [Dehalococcoidia bacterium]
MLVNLIEALGRAGRTLVTATHELDIVPLLADRVIVIGEERTILADGPPQEIRENTEVLIRANLIHEHLHLHGALSHSHRHESNEDATHHHDQISPSPLP